MITEDDILLSRRIAKANNVLLAEMVTEMHIGILACCRPDTHARLDRILRLLRDELMEAVMPEPPMPVAGGAR